MLVNSSYRIYNIKMLIG